MVTLQRSAGGARRPAATDGGVLAEFELPSEPGNERERDRARRAAPSPGSGSSRRAWNA